MAEVSLTAPTAQSTEVWKSLSQWLPGRNPDDEFWWKLCGHHLATMLEAAEYSVQKQYDSLIFFYQWMLPYMGPAPASNRKLKWKTLLGLEGSPIEYSWKWNTKSSEPDVRLTMEAIGQYTATAKDPLNQLAAREMLHHIGQVCDSVDPTWADHFFSTMFDHDVSKYNQEAAAGATFSTSCLIAAEFLPEGLSMKSYFVPRRLGQIGGLTPLAQWEEAFDKLHPDSAARAAVHQFLKAHPDKVMHPVMAAVDDVAPAESRLKFYFQTPYTSFTSVRETVTLGGHVEIPEEQLQNLRSLIIAVVGVDKDYPEDVEMHPVAQKGGDFIDLPAPVSGFGYYFDIAPGSELPAIKLYLPMHHYGQDDLSLAKGITGWMKAHGRGQYCDRYMSMLENMAYHRHLEDKKGLQSYVSCLIKKSGELDITTYIDPEALDRVKPKAKTNGASH